MSVNIMTSIWTGLPYHYVWEYYDLYLNRFAIPLCLGILWPLSEQVCHTFMYGNTHIMTAIWTGLPCCYVWEYYYLYLNRFAILLCLGILWPLSKQQCHTFLIFSNWRCQVVSFPLNLNVKLKSVQNSHGYFWSTICKSIRNLVASLVTWRLLKVHFNFSVESPSCFHSLYTFL